MDAYLEKEQIDTFLSGWGHQKGGLGGGWSLRGDPAQKVDMPSKTIQNTLLHTGYNIN